MLLKGAYCVGEHFVDPHSSFREYFINVKNTQECYIYLRNKETQQTLRFILCKQLRPPGESVLPSTLKIMH